MILKSNVFIYDKNVPNMKNDYKNSSLCGLALQSGAFVRINFEKK